MTSPLKFSHFELRPCEGGYLVSHKNGIIAGEALYNDDGYYVFWPNRNLQGYFSQHDFQALATILGALNRRWDQIVQNATSLQSPIPT